MATAAVLSHGEAAGSAHNPDSRPATTITAWDTPRYAPHPEAPEIIRQVEYYFSDENMPNDAHLLGFVGRAGTGPIEISEIMSWRKMKRFKPKTAVREALRQSDLIEIVGANQIRRRYPLTVPINVVPKINEERRKKAEILLKSRGMTKNMLKPTGFEPNASEGPMSPDEYEQEREKYSPELSFIQRIDTAINSFCSERKMHQHTRAIFEKLMLFGGFDHNLQAFQGGASKEKLKKQGYSKEEIEQQTADYYGASEQVRDSSYAEQDGWKDDVTWVIDFECVAKGFLSSQFMNFFDWYEEQQVKTATQVLRNFYNYLLVHDVCLEYSHQLRAARDICDIAEEELLKLAMVDKCLPGAFNVACSALFKGIHAGVYRHAASAAPDDDDGGWITEGDNIGLSGAQALNIFKAGIAAYGTDEQYEKANAMFNSGGRSLVVVYEEKLGLEVCAIEFPDDSQKEMYNESKACYGYIDPMGKLICKRWDVPYTPPSDLPAHLSKRIMDGTDETFEVLVEAETLAYCYPGIKIEAVVKELDIGIKWMDYVEAIFPSFYAWLPNERIRKWKEPGEPKEWMERQMKKGADSVGVVEHEGGDEYDDDEPD